MCQQFREPLTGASLIPAINPIESFAAQLSEDKLAIFLFHGVVHENTYTIRNYTNKHIDQQDFAALVQLLGERGMPLSLDEVIAHHRTGTPFPPHAFAITFDDGFENNASVAAPILDDANIPATFYITTDFVASNRMSWIDRIEFAFELVDTVSLTFPWRETKVTAVSSEDMKNLLDEIRSKVKSEVTIDPDSFATDIQRQCKLPETWSNVDPIDQKMSWDQVRALNDAPLFQVGGHTHTHATMSFLSPDALADEIDTSISLLTANAGVPPAHYSYPEGLAHCYSNTVIDALKARGVVCCPTAENGVNDISTDLFHLRRIFVN